MLFRNLVQVHALPSVTRASVKSFFRPSSSLAQVIPSNLTLADPAVLKEPKAPIIKPEEYLFPLFRMDTSVPVRPFKTPNAFAEAPIEINPKVFGVAIRKDIVHDVIRYHRAKLRQPQKTKRMSEIRGSNKKPHPQKGTGRAQAGHHRNSVWRGGQKAHGRVVEKKFAFALNRKVRAMGMMIALAAKHREGNLLVFDNFELETLKTKEFFKLLEGHGLHETGCIFVDNEFNENFSTASRNVKRVTTLTMQAVHVYELVRREKLAITSAALLALQDRLISQYTHESNRRSLLNRMNMYQAISDYGRKLKTESSDITTESTDSIGATV